MCLLTRKMAWKAAMSCAASSSCRQSSPDLTMTGLKAQPARLPWGLALLTRAHFSANLNILCMISHDPVLSSFDTRSGQLGWAAWAGQGPAGCKLGRRTAPALLGRRAG